MSGEKNSGFVNSAHDAKSPSRCSSRSPVVLNEYDTVEDLDPWNYKKAIYVAHVNYCGTREFNLFLIKSSELFQLLEIRSEDMK